MQIEPIAIFHSPIQGKFGVPRQSGLASSLPGQIELTGRFRNPDALRGLEGFDYLWIIWNFNLNSEAGEEGFQPTVRPPRLGGNERIGVFASRSPFRPNGLGLSSARIESVDAGKGIISVSGADLADGTPIFDIKPYVEYADAHTGIRNGFVDSRRWEPLEVVIPEGMATAAGMSQVETEALAQILSLDPRPAYQENPAKVYGLDFAGHNVKFCVSGTTVTVLSL